MGRKKSYEMLGPPGRVCVGLTNVRMYLKWGYTFRLPETKLDYETDIAKHYGAQQTTSTPTGVVPTAGLFKAKKAATASGSSKE